MQDSKIKYALCTLFDSNYLDKGLVLYDSLQNHSSSFTLYVLAMNEKCYEVLTDLKLANLVPIKLSSFENEDLLRVKKTRSVAEYCWTCGSSLIKYVFETYTPDYCSYIDADMAFYDDPILLLEELEKRDATVSIVGHRFPWYNSKSESKRVGTYCVECNTFKNEPRALKLLDKWVGQCLDYCSIDGDGIHWADQKYLDCWVEEYDFVIETEMLGAGVAPWNLSQYKLIDNSADGRVHLKCRGKDVPLLFFHFENIKFLNNKTVNIDVYNAWFIDEKLVNLLYVDYLKKIMETKDMLKKEYGIEALIKHHPGLQTPRKGLKIVNLFKHLFMNKEKSSLLFTLIPSMLFKKKNIFTIN